MKNPKNILITGASSGIGCALAVAYSAADVNLFCVAEMKKIYTKQKSCASN